MTIRIFCLSTAIVLISFFISMQANFDWNITGFYRFGDQLPLSPYLNSDDIRINRNQVGYDGQFFLTIALDPTLSNDGTIASLDFPRYRMKRIALPVLAYLLSSGNRQFIPYTIIFLNGLLMILAAVFLSRLRTDRDEQRNWGPLLFFAIPGIWVSFSFATAELAVAAFVVISYFYCSRNNSVPAALFVLLACLTKETAVLFFVGYIFVSLWERQWRRVAIYLLAMLPFLGWHLYLSIAFPVNGTFSELGNFGYPFQGHIAKLWQLFVYEGHVNKNEYIFYTSLILAGLYLLFRLPSLWQNQKALFIAASGYLFILMQSSMAILDYHLGYSRVFLAIFVILLLSQSHPMNRIAKGFWIFTSLVALRYLYWFWT